MLLFYIIFIIHIISYILYMLLRVYDTKHLCYRSGVHFFFAKNEELKIGSFRCFPSDTTLMRPSHQ